MSGHSSTLNDESPSPRPDSGSAAGTIAETWYASVTTETAIRLTDAVAEAILDVLGGEDCFVGSSDARQTVTANFIVDADTSTDAHARASSVAHRAFTAAGIKPHIVAISVTTKALMDIHEPNNALMGYAEIGHVLGIPSQQVAELHEQHPDFPAPMHRLASGPLFVARAVRNFARGWNNNAPASVSAPQSEQRPGLM